MPRLVDLAQKPRRPIHSLGSHGPGPLAPNSPEPEPSSAFFSIHLLRVAASLSLLYFRDKKRLLRTASYLKVGNHQPLAALRPSFVVLLELLLLHQPSCHDVSTTGPHPVSLYWAGAVQAETVGYYLTSNSSMYPFLPTSGGATIHQMKLSHTLAHPAVAFRRTAPLTTTRAHSYAAIIICLAKGYTRHLVGTTLFTGQVKHQLSQARDSEIGTESPVTRR